MPYTTQAGAANTVSRSFLPNELAFIWVNHSFSTSYQEAIPVVQTVKSRAVASRYDRRAGRTFNLTFPMLWYLSLSSRTPAHLSLTLLEKFYQDVGMYKPFKYIHPIYGKLTVRFAAPLNIPAPTPGGRGSVQGLTLQLIELVTDDHPYQLKTIFSNTVFNYPNHTVATTYPAEVVTMQLGQNYNFASSQYGKPERTFSLTFASLCYYFDMDDNINPLANPKNNMGNLELMYHFHRTTGVFTYNHPILGALRVRFARPLDIPSPSGPHAAILNVTVDLLEVHES